MNYVLSFAAHGHGHPPMLFTQLRYAMRLARLLERYANAYVTICCDGHMVYETE